MTFAVKSFKSEFDKGDRGIVLNRQFSVLELSLAATDVVVDLGDKDGALHTDLITTPVGKKVSERLLDIAKVCEAGPLIHSDQLFTKLRVLNVAGNNEYKLEVSNKMPKITFNTADAPTTLRIEMYHVLQGSKTAITSDYRSE